MTSDSIDYQRFVEDALRDAVRRLLVQVAEEGMPGENYFYVGFRTGHAGVSMPRALRDLYPDEMTIILQHQFWNLEVEEDEFCVELSFSGSRQQLCIPFAALTTFADPSAEFALRFVSSVPGASDSRSPSLVVPSSAAPAERSGPRAAPAAKPGVRRSPAESPGHSSSPSSASPPLAPLGVERSPGAAAAPLRMPSPATPASLAGGDEAPGEAESTDHAAPAGEAAPDSGEARKPGEVIRFDPSRRR